MKHAWHRRLLLGILLLAGCQSGIPAPQAMPGHEHPPPESGAGARAASPAPPEAGVHAVAIRNFVYDPATVSIRVGESVKWTNYDAAPHDAVALTGSWKTPLLKVNESATQTYSAPGSYPYYCTVHPAMRGTVEVHH
ncbi:Amicyanin-alpha precursor [compost metagenome]